MDKQQLTLSARPFRTSKADHTLREMVRFQLDNYVYISLSTRLFLPLPLPLSPPLESLVYRLFCLELQLNSKNIKYHHTTIL
jgi:hypothetical protein